MSSMSDKRWHALVDDIFELDAEHPYLGRMIEEQPESYARTRGEKYSADQPRDDGGQWTDGDGSSASDSGASSAGGGRASAGVSYAQHASSLVSVAENGQISLKKPKNYRDAASQLSTLNKMLEAASKDKSEKSELRLFHVRGQMKRAMGYAKSLLKKADDDELRQLLAELMDKWGLEPSYDDADVPDIKSLWKFNEDQPRDDRGRWSDGGGSSSGGGDKSPPKWTQETDKTGRPIPIKVDKIEDAIGLVMDGKVVEMPDVKSAATLLSKLAEHATQAAKDGDKAKDFDACNISVAGTNLFCGQTIRDSEHPKGWPRIAMPQFGGKPVPGSEADKLPRTPWNKSEVDAAQQFIQHLDDVGIGLSYARMKASDLKASQAELVGTKVAAMMNDEKFNPGRNPVFVSSDNYIIDGHHRWAAVVGRDAKDNKLGDLKISVRKVNAPISEILHLGNKWAAEFGIAQNAGPGSKPKTPKSAGGCGCADELVMVKVLW